MALSNYNEIFETWDGTEGGKGTGDDGQWHVYNVSENHNIPASAILEVNCVNEYNITEYQIGLRSTASSGEADSFRLFNLAESEVGDNNLTLHVQLDGSGCLQYYVEHADRLHFDIVGYWLGGVYVDAFDEFDPSSESTWEGVALDTYGVSSGDVAEIAMFNAADATDRTMGVRSSGTSLDRRFDIKEAEAGGEEGLSVFVNPSGTNAAIEVWSESNTDCAFRLVGYWTTPPGDYTESAGIDFPTPSSDDDWEELNTAASGIPSGLIIAQFAIKHEAPATNSCGMREAGSDITTRLIVTDRQESPVAAPSWATLHTTINTDGVTEYSCSDVSDGTLFRYLGHWDNFTQNATPFPTNDNMNLYIEGLNPFIHYVEDLTSDVSPSTQESWESLDLSAEGYPGDSVAEIIMGNQDFIEAASGLAGIRETSSSLERKLLLRNSPDLTADLDYLSWHIQLDTNGQCEIFTSGNNAVYDDTYGLGYWVGPRYVELFESFKASSSGSWVNHNLASLGVPPGKIAEILVSNEDGVTWHSGGIRQVGSVLDRTVEINGIWHEFASTPSGVDVVPMTVNTSGSSSTIQVYAGNSDAMTFYVVGYWDFAPGTFNELAQEITPDTANSTWTQLDINSLYSIPSGAVVDILLGNIDTGASTRVGAREIDPTLTISESESRTDPDRTFFVRETHAGGSTFGADYARLHVNAISGLVEFYHSQSNANIRFHTLGYWDDLSLIPQNASGQINMYVSGVPADISGTVPMYIHGAEIAELDLYVSGIGFYSDQVDCYTQGIFFSKTDSEFSEDYPSGLALYVNGGGIISSSGQTDLYINGHEQITNSGNLYTDGLGLINASGDLYLKTIDFITDDVNLYIHNPIDTSSGLPRESGAVFYMSRRDNYSKTDDDVLERVRGIDWLFPSVIIGNRWFIGTSGATNTAGDGTLPQYDDLGGSFSSSYLGFAEVGDVPLQQNVMGHVVDPYDYPFAGSGSIMTAFWMSGAKTSGNAVDVGWFKRDGDYDDPGNAYKTQTIGIEIGTGNSITVRTSIRDLPYEQISGGGLWWGGTTHYGTPSSSSSSWNPDEDAGYWTWNESWPAVNISHDEIAFFVIRTEFVPSGMTEVSQDHMNVYLSVDGSDWSFIGSGATGPPASSLYSASNPRNQLAENAVGFQLHATNSNFGEESVRVAECVLWTDSDTFNADELSDLESIVSTYNRPLDEYIPTINPPETYITRTVSDFILPPIPLSGASHSNIEISSGVLVTLEVGLGNYGEDCDAYLLEEVPPSGFYIRNIRPDILSTYPGQDSRPYGARQQIWHDPQSGIFTPVDEFGRNTSGATIRWTNHDNHPEHNIRRTPTPTGIYTYELYPIRTLGESENTEFTFSGSGLFFGGTTGESIFDVITSGTTSGTTAGLTGGVLVSSVNLYMSAPDEASGTLSLYIESVESITSAYIGTTSRTPEVGDFAFVTGDAEAGVDQFAGIEYGPPLYIKGPLPYSDSFNMYIPGPAGNDCDLYVQGYDIYSTSGDYPSGLGLYERGHIPVSGDPIDLYILGPVPESGQVNLHIGAGAFGFQNLYMRGHVPYAGQVSGYIKGPEFITTSGDFTYPLDSSLFQYPSGGLSPNLYIKGPEFIVSSGSFAYPGDSSLFTYPSGGQSPDLYMLGYDISSGTVPMYIGPPRVNQEWTLFLKTEASSATGTLGLFTHASASGVTQQFHNIPFYIEADDVDYPYTGGGNKQWNMFLKAAQTDYLPNNTEWTLFLKCDFDVSGSVNLHTYGHASGQNPHGPEITGTVNMVCSIDPDDPGSIGYIPFNSDDDPWSLFLKSAGFSDSVDMYVSGDAPVSIFGSGNLFIEGLFEAESGVSNLYLFGVSGLVNNAPGGLPLYLDGIVQVYNNSTTIYIHGY